MAELLETSTSKSTRQVAQPGGLDAIVARLDSLTLRRAVWIAFFLALVTSIFITYVARPILNRQAPLGGEAYDGYIELAENLVRGHGYVFEPGGHKVFHRPPLYPVLLTPGILLPEPAWRLYVAVLNSTMFAIASLLVFRLAASLFNRKVGWLAWLIFTTNPFILWSAKNALSAICQMLAYLLILYFSWVLFLRSRNRERISFGFHAAFTASLFAAVMSHGTMLAVAAFILSLFAAWGLWNRSWAAVRSAVLIAAVLALLIAPWTWRNYKVTGMFIPVAGNSGLAYFAGNAHWGITEPPAGRYEGRHQAEIRHIGLPVEQTRNLIKFYGFSSPEAEQFANARFKEHVRSHPADLAKKVYWNALEYYLPIVYCLFPPEGSGFAEVSLALRLQYSNIDVIPLSLYNMVLVCLAVAGWVLLFRRRATRFAGICLLVAWAAFAVPYFPFLTFVGHGLYNFGTIPVLAICSAAFLMRGTLSFKEQIQ